MEPESDDHFAYIAGYTSGGAPYGITWEEQEELERRAAAKKSATPPEQKESVSLNDDPLDDSPEWEQEIIRETAEFLAREDDGENIPLPI